jgi:hypothetical protein
VIRQKLQPRSMGELVLQSNQTTRRVRTWGSANLGYALGGSLAGAPGLFLGKLRAPNKTTTPGSLIA